MRSKKPSMVSGDCQNFWAYRPRVLSRGASAKTPSGKGQAVRDCHAVTRSAISPAGAEKRDFRRGARFGWGFCGVDLASGPAEVVFVDFAEIQRVMFAGSHDRAVSRSFEGERSRFNVECQGVGAGVSAAGVRW